MDATAVPQAHLGFTPGDLLAELEGLVKQGAADLAEALEKFAGTEEGGAKLKAAFGRPMQISFQEILAMLSLLQTFVTQALATPVGGTIETPVGVTVPIPQIGMTFKLTLKGTRTA